MFAILSCCVAWGVMSAVERPLAQSVVLSEAKDLVAGQRSTVEFRPAFLFAGRMLHFVQHDKSWIGHFIMINA